MAAHTRDDDPVQGSVSLPIAIMNKPVPICLSARRWDRAGSAQLCNRGLRADALRVISGEDHRCGRACPYPGRLDPLRSERRGQCIEGAA